MSTELEPTLVNALVRQRRVIVCCGAGGVGKTTTAAALGIAGARLGRRVLVLTVDPSLRLAEALGVSRNPPEPVKLPAERAALAKLTGDLEVWMLDPKGVAEATVRRLVADPVQAQRVLDNRLYQHATSMIAGMHEYAAMEALHGFLASGRYDLVVLDTPPSRNALDFLEAPGRVASFLESSVFKTFLPKQGGLLQRAKTKLVSAVLPRLLGDEFASELGVFLSAFTGLFSALSSDLGEMRRMLSQKDVAFLLVTSPSAAAVTEAHFFHDKMRQLALPFAGFVLNRIASPGELPFPSAALAPAGSSPALASGLEKLKPFARMESLQALRDKGVLAELALRAGTTGFAVPVPLVPAELGPMEALLEIGERLMNERRSGPR